MIWTEEKAERQAQLLGCLADLRKEGYNLLDDEAAEEEEYCHAEYAGKLDELPRIVRDSYVPSWDEGAELQDVFDLPYNPADKSLGQYSKLKRAGPYTHVTIWEKRPTGGPVRRIAAGQKIERIKVDVVTKAPVLDPATGEIQTEVFEVPEGGIYYNTITGQTYETDNKSKADVNKYHLYETFQNIRDYINANIEPFNCKFLTLTYANENIKWKNSGIQDEKQVYDDFIAFWKRFKRYSEKHGLDIPEYINIIEPQARGAWHYHTLLFYNGRQPFIDIWELNKLWGKGIVFVKAIKDNITNYGAYFTAYFTDISLDEIEGSKIVDHYLGAPIDSIKQDDGTEKKIIKGGRIWMYPAGMRLLRTSKDIKKPLVEDTTKGEALAATQGFSVTFEKQGKLYDSMGKKVNGYRKTSYIDSKYYSEEKQEARRNKVE